MDQNPSFIGKLSGISVRIAYRNSCHSGKTFCNKSSTITYRSSTFHIFHIGHMAFQFHGWCQFYHIPFHLFRRINTVNGNSRTDNVKICLRHTDNSRTVGTVAYRNMDSSLFQKIRKNEDICQAVQVPENGQTHLLWQNA